ncbi:MAG: histidine kinase, partial [Actinobacteria bacterium]|nr:histidine kinase [Actinomycetota bacterium]
YMMKWVNYNGKDILQLEVSKGKFKPYSTKDGDFYIRVGSIKRKASREELSRLLQSSGHFQFDNTPVGHANVNDLETGKLSEYFRDIYKVDIYDRKEVPDVETLLENAKILTISEGRLCPTIAGLLIFAAKPQEFLFHSGIIFARINGNEIYDEIIDSKQLEGRLPELIEQCLTLFRLYNRRQSTFKDGKRTDSDEYLEKVFREIMVNAVCHRNYSISGSRIRVLMFNDRHEVRSPGRLPNTITIDNVKTGTSFLRNQLIFKFLNHYGYMENLGRGIPMCIRETLKFTGKPLELAEEGEEFVVRVFKKNSINI